MRQRATWDDGWSGRHVHALGPDDPPDKRSLTVHEPENDTLLYVEMDGARFRVLRREQAGFKP